MVNFFVGILIYCAVAGVLSTAGVDWQGWQLWAVIALMIVDKANLRHYITGSIVPSRF